jgi:hypothetical protein
MKARIKNGLRSTFGRSFFAPLKRSFDRYSKQTSKQKIQLEKEND